MAPNKAHAVPFKQWRPGRPAAHRLGKAGTIGAFVDLSEETRERLSLDDDPPKPAFVGAAHVLAYPPKGARGDHILSPGPPDFPRLASYRRAKLAEFPELSRGDIGDPNEADIALAVMNDYKPISNTVPSPAEPTKLVSLEGAYTRGEIALLVEEKAMVFMIGRSGFSRGRLSPEEAETVTLKTYSDDFYRYKNCFIVKSENSKVPFSEVGDSGALIYSKERKAVGFVVGANGNKTYFYPAKESLDLIGVTLI